MSPPPSVLLPAHLVSTRRLAAGAAALAVAATLFSAGLALAALANRTAVAPVVPVTSARDACALPADRVVERALAVLSDTDRSLLLRRAILCSDLEHGRLSLVDYRTRLDELTAGAAPAAEPDPEVVWADRILESSSQYGSDDWSAARALGPPDVETPGADSVQAWASETADDRVEFLEVGFATARRIRGVEILESVGPGAVSEVELIDQDGNRQVVYRGKAEALGQPWFRRQIDFACTGRPIAAVRVTLDSRVVPDWNEIDAIGVQPCGS